MLVHVVEQGEVRLGMLDADLPSTLSYIWHLYFRSDIDDAPSGEYAQQILRHRAMIIRKGAIVF